MTTGRLFIQSLLSTETASTVTGHMLLDDNPTSAWEAALAAGRFHDQGKAP